MNDAAVAVWCVIVAKDFARAKSRLSPVLSDQQRHDLSRAMFTHVLSLCLADASVTRTLIATDAAAIERLAIDAGAQALRDERHDVLGRVIDRALEHAQANGASHAVIVMSDLPRLREDDLRGLIDALKDHDVAIAPDRARLGTNALALRLTDRLPTCFGRADSFDAHQQAARMHGLRVAVIERAGLAFDVDTSDDLQALDALTSSKA